jgi:hypothetical protein
MAEQIFDTRAGALAAGFIVLQSPTLCSTTARSGQSVQTVLRIGYPITPAARTPRRPLEDVLLGTTPGIAPG